MRSQAEHDIFLSAYTPEGTFTYDAAIAFFNLRYELRGSGPDSERLVELEAIDEAERFLADDGVHREEPAGYVVDMSTMTNDTRRLRDRDQSEQRVLLVGQQPRLRVQSAGEAGELAVAADHPVARDDDAQRVAPVRRAHGAGRVRAPTLAACSP